MGCIEKRSILPTRDGIKVMCDLFGCLPMDIYNAHDIDLLAVKREPEQPAKGENVKVKTVSME